jgi:transmembrane 9 superfamily protein 2/4
MNSELNTDSVLSRGYYHPRFHFCRPKDGPKDVGSESLGSILFGDRIKTSPFKLNMMKNESCKPLCEAKFDPKSAIFTTKRILENLQHNWLVDGLPVGQPYTIDGGPDIFYTLGFPLGAVEPKTERPVLHNHIDIGIDYHAIGAGQYRVVGVQAIPSSRQNSRIISETDADCGDSDQTLQLNPEGQTTVAWTYSVDWRPSKTAWSTRWDIYLHLQNPEIHWLSIMSTAVLVLFLVATVSALLMRALKRDFARYNKLDAFSLEDFSTSAAIEDGVQEDSGWKLVHGDVFRPPKNPLLLSLLLGNGAQLFFMTGVTIAFALLGFLSPSNRGSLGTAMVMLYTIFGFIGGYVSARVYKTFGGEAWKRNIVLTPVLVPGIVFGTFFLLDLFLWAQQSSGAVPFTTMLVLIAIWFLISVPLSFAGSWIGFKQAVINPHLVCVCSPNG